MSLDLTKLREPFPANAISWRVGSTTQDKTKGMALAFIDARDVQDRLDAVCGVGGWQCRYPHANGKTVCEIGVLIGDQWIWKADGAGDSDVEAEKGALSDAFKRAAVRWGVGRYLYDLDSPWVEIEPAGKSFRIKRDQYDVLRALLMKHGAPRGEVPMPASAPSNGATRKMTPDEWVEKAKAELTAIHGSRELGTWMARNAKAIDALHKPQDTAMMALYNAINTHISIRNQELQQKGRP